MAFTSWNDILNKPKGIDEVPEIVLTVGQLSASVLSLGEDVGEVAGDVQEIALEVSQLSASTLPYGPEETIKEKIDTISNLDHETIITGIDAYLSNEHSVEITFGTDFNTDIADGAIIATLPLKFRPSVIRTFQVFNTTGTFLGNIRVEVNGEIHPTFGVLKAGKIRTSFNYIK